MTDNDFSRFSALWSAMNGMYRNDSVTSAALALSFRALQDYSVDDVQWAMSEAIKTSVYPPTPASIRKILGDKYGTSDACKLIAISDFFSDLDADINIYYDYVCADAQAVRAFKKSFRSVERYYSADKFERYQMMTDFKTLYGKVALTGDVYEDHVIFGRENNQLTQWVRCLGGHQACKSLIAAAYGDRQVNIAFLASDPDCPPERKALIDNYKPLLMTKSEER